MPSDSIHLELQKDKLLVTNLASTNFHLRVDVEGDKKGTRVVSDVVLSLKDTVDLTFYLLERLSLLEGNVMFELKHLDKNNKPVYKELTEKLKIFNKLGVSLPCQTQS